MRLIGASGDGKSSDESTKRAWGTLRANVEFGRHLASSGSMSA